MQVKMQVKFICKKQPPHRRAAAFLFCYIVCQNCQVSCVCKNAMVCIYRFLRAYAAKVEPVGSVRKMRFASAVTAAPDARARKARAGSRRREDTA